MYGHGRDAGAPRLGWGRPIAPAPSPSTYSTRQTEGANHYDGDCNDRRDGSGYSDDEVGKVVLVQAIERYDLVIMYADLRA